MSEEATAQAEVANQGASQDPWEKLAESYPQNRDLHVQTTDPLFTGQTKLGKVKSVEPVRSDDGGLLQARLTFEMQAEMIDTDGNKRAPGYLFRPRAFTLHDAADPAAAERGCRDLGRIMETAKLIGKGSSPRWPELIRGVGKLAGQSFDIRFEAKKGSKRNPETGQFPTFQNLSFALPGTAQAATNGEATASASLDQT